MSSMHAPPVYRASTMLPPLTYLQHEQHACPPRVSGIHYAAHITILTAVTPSHVAEVGCLQVRCRVMLLK